MDETSSKGPAYSEQNVQGGADGNKKPRLLW